MNGYEMVVFVFWVLVAYAVIATAIVVFALAVTLLLKLVWSINDTGSDYE